MLFSAELSIKFNTWLHSRGFNASQHSTEINLKIIIIVSAHCEIWGAHSGANENLGWGVARRLLAVTSVSEKRGASVFRIRRAKRRKTRVTFQGTNIFERPQNMRFRMKQARFVKLFIPLPNHGMNFKWTIRISIYSIVYVNMLQATAFQPGEIPKIFFFNSRRTPYLRKRLQARRSWQKGG